MGARNRTPSSGVSFPMGCRKNVRWLSVMLVPLVPLAMPAMQAPTPQAALEEIATTAKPEVIARHLPEQVQKRIEVLPIARKQEVLGKLLSLKADQLGGCTVRRGSDADAWEIVDPNGDSRGKVRLANSVISGLEALLFLKLELGSAPQTFIVAMHLEDDDWRIDSFGEWQNVDLGLNKLTHQPTEMEKNEAAAPETIKTIARALYSYSSSFPYGFPSQLRVLTGKAGEEASADHAGLLDESFAAEPLVKDGYLFRYRLIEAGGWVEIGNHRLLGRGRFEIRATPLEYGKTGSKNFLSSESSIHVTTQNRDADGDDPTPDDDSS